MVRLKTVGGESAGVAAESIADPWASVIGGVEVAADSPVAAAETTVADTAAATIIELPPVAVEPLPVVESEACEVVEVAEEGSAEVGMPQPDPATVKASMEAYERGDYQEVEQVIEDLTGNADSPAVAAAKLAYLQAALRLSAMEVRIGRLDVEIAGLEEELEESKSKREELQEAAEPQHESVLSLYAELAGLLPPEELAAYEAEIESGAVSMPPSTEEVSPWSSGDTDTALSSSSGTMDPDHSSNEWWSKRPTSELDFSSVKGCGKKKIEAILEACPTMGDFEKLRADFYNGGLKQIAGVGEKLAGELENLALDWLTKNRDAAILSASVIAGADAETQQDAAPPPVVAGNSPPESDDQGVGNAESPEPADGIEGEEAEEAEPADADDSPLALDVVVVECGEDEGENDGEAVEAESTEADASETVEATPPPSDAESAELDDNRRALAELTAIFKEKGAAALAPPPNWQAYFDRGRSDFEEGIEGWDCIYTGGEMRTWWMAGWILAADEAGRA